MSFRSAMRLDEPRRMPAEVTDSDGLNATQYDLVLGALKHNEDIAAAYSAGGGNHATLEAFEALGRECAVFIAHDLDHDNIRLLREHRLSAVLHHDLRQDMRRACRIIMRAHRALPEDGPALPSTIQVVTPLNMPPGTASVPHRRLNPLRVRSAAARPPANAVDTADGPRTAELRRPA